MKITDKEVLKQLKIVRCYELEESIKDYPEDERNGRSDMQFLADEVSYRLSLYGEGTCTGEDYEEAKEFLNSIKGGKIPCWNTIPPTPKYTPVQLEIKTNEAKEIVNEYRRLRSLMDRLNKKGYYGSW